MPPRALLWLVPALIVGFPFGYFTARRRGRTGSQVV